MYHILFNTIIWNIIVILIKHGLQSAYSHVSHTGKLTGKWLPQSPVDTSNCNACNGRGGGGDAFETLPILQQTIYKLNMTE